MARIRARMAQIYVSCCVQAHTTCTMYAFAWHYGYMDTKSNGTGWKR